MIQSQGGAHSAGSVWLSLFIRYSVPNHPNFDMASRPYFLKLTLSSKRIDHAHFLSSRSSALTTVPKPGDAESTPVALMSTTDADVVKTSHVPSNLLGTATPAAVTVGDCAA